MSTSRNNIPLPGRPGDKQPSTFATAQNSFASLDTYRPKTHRGAWLWGEYSLRMPGIPSLRISHRQRRTFVSTLFGLTFFASVLTVSASNILPCPVRPDRSFHADNERKSRGGGPPAVVEKRPRRWIQERAVTEH